MNIQTHVMLLADRLLTLSAWPQTLSNKHDLACGGAINGVANPEPSTAGLPGSGFVADRIGNAKFIAICAVLAGIFIGVAIMGIAGVRGDGDHVRQGKAAIVIGFMGAIVVGAAYSFVASGISLGGTIC